ncbi:chemotaxis protein CheX [Helicobacter monodelphidis]|uniref:chemotaxis protein CheX n=1 Tax=Helicobacter sp. 15-1451 TaxID=2004995 RepID=UPI000DCE51F2|nr:chemotaxis protein CheX [Helicobacter sp. 15-1451]RAX57932.1 chemotaxis protein CheX [Helicobacter sp. 15-1451]
MKPVISQNVVIYYADEDLDSSVEEQVCKVIAGSASSIKSLQLQALFFSLRSNIEFQDSAVVAVAHTLLKLQKQLDIVVAICEYNGEQFKQLKELFPNKAIPLFKTISQAMLFLQIKSPPSGTPAVVFEKDTVMQTLIVQSLEAKGIEVCAVQNIKDFRAKQQELGNNALYVYDMQFDITANHIPVQISQGVVTYHFYKEVDGKIPRFFSMQTHALRLAEGFKVFIFNMKDTEVFDIKAVDFFISLARNGVTYNAVFIFVGVHPGVLDIATEDKIRRANIFIYPDKASALKNEKISALANLYHDKKPQKLSKKLVANLLYFVNASLETLKSLTGGVVEKKAHRVIECDIANKDGIMGAVISFEGDISGKLVLVFSREIAKEAALMMLGDEIKTDEEFLDIISEFTNIIAGRSKALLSEKNITIGISLPKPYIDFKDLYELVRGQMGVQIDFLLNKKPLHIFLTY